MANYTRPLAQFPPPQTQDPRIPYLHDADHVEHDLWDDGHRLWGFVIYRCTYESDSAWTEFMNRLLASTEEMFDWETDLEVLDRLALTVFEDSGMFNGASTAVVREHFNRWAVDAVQKEQGTVQGQGQVHPGSQRYRYCIQVTQDVLDSVLAGDYERNGFVRVIRADWEVYEPYDHGERIEEEEEPLEGCTLEDVGWVKVQFDGMMFIAWGYLRSDWAWGVGYRRPPKIAHFF
ncbi:uncharacterized protein N7496_010077 [Penicillium cataractarum]|uniref:Uncharacterized protein n=1 Tax=Penicillium cataractarum TaxID=2100454 RepID=A0A9W9RSB2_9EURO|nr:uncharacterized protein N7496_010077 [Penicillium cataractarum]KAJ5364364.1 hypothetical protein N7496_010077 [Penicillium cataractarum]